MNKVVLVLPSYFIIVHVHMLIHYHKINMFGKRYHSTLLVQDKPICACTNMLQYFHPVIHMMVHAIPHVCFDNKGREQIYFCNIFNKICTYIGKCIVTMSIFWHITIDLVLAYMCIILMIVIKMYRNCWQFSLSPRTSYTKMYLAFTTLNINTRLLQ